jgi:hypothetical protein
MSEEHLVLIEDVKNTLLSEAAIREDTANNLAMIIVTKYNISFIGERPQKPMAKPKIASPSLIQQVIKKPNIVKMPEIPEGISEKEREDILENAIREKYNMVDQIQSQISMDPSTIDIIESQNGLFDNEASFLEQERIMRLANQQKEIRGGGKGKIHRSSG